MRGGEQVGEVAESEECEGKKHNKELPTTLFRHVSLGGEAMVATGCYGDGAGHPSQAVEAPQGQPNPHPPRTGAMAGSTSHRRVLRDVWREVA